MQERPRSSPDPTPPSTRGSAGRAPARSTRGRSLIDHQKAQAADAIDDFIAAILDAAHRLEENGQDTLARSALSVARRADRVSQYVRERPVEEMFYDAKAAARRLPAAFLASAFAVGVVLARFTRGVAPHHLEA